MSRLISRAEVFQRAYSALESVNFAAFDYGTIKQSLLDYMKLYYPETFNDFIESSELIALIETFAHIADTLAYRYDINARENLLPVAQRRESLLRLAKAISYKATRPIPARGLVKITAVSTTAGIIDANGLNLANRNITWNDGTNSNWKAQFIAVMNEVLDGGFGSVAPSDRFQIQDELFELYRMDHTPLRTGVMPFSTSVSGRPVNMELVPVQYAVDIGISERRPEVNALMNVLYGNDGLGDSSPTTGFFFYVKQGTLQRQRHTFNGVTPNQTYTVDFQNINDTDVWLNQVDPSTGAIVDTTSVFEARNHTGRTGEWIQVDAAHAENVIFNTNPLRNKFEVETRDGNSVRLNFGDGIFANIPSGAFDIWVRTSLNEDLVVPAAAVNNQTSSLSYVDRFGRTQTITFTYNLVAALQNGSAAETDEHIRLTAPAVYYTQDRMVNGEDYNNFPMKDPSILKLRSINRTFVGDSKYVKWSDATGTYDNVNIFGNDGAFYLDESISNTTVSEASYDVLISQHIEPILSSTDIFIALTGAGVSPTKVRRFFTEDERSDLVAALTPPPFPNTVLMFYSVANDRWTSHKSSAPDTFPSEAINRPLITIDQGQIQANRTVISWASSRYVLHSDSTMFWSDNDAERVINYNTLGATPDTLNVLQANINNSHTGVLSQNWRYAVLGRDVVRQGPEAGQPDINKLVIMPINEFGFPAGTDPYDETLPFGAVADLIVPKFDYVMPANSRFIKLPVHYIASAVVGQIDVKVQMNGQSVPFREILDSNDIGSEIELYDYDSAPTGTTVRVTVNEYVYRRRDTAVSNWTLMPDTYETLVEYIRLKRADPDSASRCLGKRGINFAWLHATNMHQLIDPSPTNIIDTFVITKGYYTEFKRWLENNTVEPNLPTPFDLRMTYNYLLSNKMISDTMVLQPGRFKLLFGNRAIPELQGQLRVIRAANGTMTDNQIKNQIVANARAYFDLARWEFGESFYFDELSTALRQGITNEVSSIVFVPTYPTHYFGDGYEVKSREDEVFYCDINNDNIDIVLGYTPTNLKQVPDRLVDA